MRVERPLYLNRLIDRMHNGMVKIITGIKRCGKSFLLFELFKDHLKSQGIDDSCIIRIPLDSEDFEVLQPKRGRNTACMAVYLKFFYKSAMNRNQRSLKMSSRKCMLMTLSIGII